MFKAVNPKQSFPELEEKILKYWKESESFQKSIDIRKNAPEFVFYDGPPFATGLPHYGHILAWTIKDVIPRYKTMRGYKVNRRFGWDCHGLPVENLIEKELNLPDKKALQEYWVDNFNEACRSSVLRYTSEWEKTVSRMWRWVDFKNSYKTMDKDYMESIWWVFSQLWEKDMVYQGHKPMHICPRCVTPLSNFEVTQGYKDLSDLSMTAKFKVNKEKSCSGKSGCCPSGDIFFLAWTTTPWTLPWNVALAVWAEIEYSFVQREWENTTYILATEAIKNYEKELGWEWNYKIVDKKLGKEIAEKKPTYEPLFPYFAKEEKNWWFRVVTWDFVTTESWTWIVHVAPAFWEDDMKIWKDLNLPFIQHVKMDWLFVPEVVDFQDEPVKIADKNMEMDKKIVRFLKQQWKVFQEKTLKHSYPTCWRCDTPLLNYATKSWFVKVEEIKDKLLENNQKINWTPKHLKDWRFWKWLEWARDWAISRNRYWWTPLPIWQNDTNGNFKCIWSVEELEKLSWEKVEDLHKHFVDKTEFSIPWEEWTYKRIEEVFDCWFESWAMPYAQKHFPFEENIVLKNEFYWARHWEWIHNVAWEISCCPEDQKKAHLTEKGKKDVGKNAKKLWVKFDYVFTSPFLRTRETAEIIQKHCWGELIEDERIVEFNCWDFHWESVLDWRNWKLENDWWSKAPNWGETLRNIVERVSAFYTEINNKYNWKKILVVTHSWIIWISQKYLKWVRDEKTYKIPVEFPVWCIEKFETSFKFPADFIAEWLDQTRGWFYTLHVLSTALFDKPAFDNVVVNWIVLAEDGQKMSKSKKNYPDPQIIFDKYWADAMRFYLMNSPVVYWENFRFSEKGVEEVVKSVLLPLWNSYSFFVMYGNIDRVGITPHPSPIPRGEGTKHPSPLGRGAGGEGNLTDLDRWILSELEILTREVTEKMDNYDLAWASRLFPKFFDNITNWYIRRSRKRFWSKAWGKNQEDKQIAYNTLYKVLMDTCKLLAPFCPFIADEIYQNLEMAEGWGLRAEVKNNTCHPEVSEATKDPSKSDWAHTCSKIPQNLNSSANKSTSEWQEKELESVHLQSWPNLESEFIDEKLSKKIATVQSIISLGLWLRKKLKIKVRQPLKKAIIAMPDIDISDQIETIKEELNVKSLEFLSDASEIAEVLAVPNAKILWPKFWKKMQEIIKEAKSWNYKKSDNWNIEVCWEELTEEEIAVRYQGKDWKEVNAQDDLVVSLNTEITEDLRLEWLARDLIRWIAEMRKEAGYEITDRIKISFQGWGLRAKDLEKIVEQFWDFINQETLSSFVEIKNPDLESEVEGIIVRIIK